MKRILILLVLVLNFSCGNSDDNGSSSTDNPTPIPQEEEMDLEVLLDRSEVIWGFDFLPDQRIIFTERSGKIFIYNPETNNEIEVSNVPTVSTGGEGGLMDLKLHPNFSSNNQLYFCYSVAGRSVALGRGRLQGSSLIEVEQVFKTVDANNSSIHFGCRIAFQNANTLFLSTGDQSEASKAQELGSHLGKILRINTNGSAPLDNPFVSNPQALPEIWSLGHRNPQGLTFNPQTNELFSSEHGPRGGDELNVILPGENYGWPLVTSGLPPGDLGESAPGYQDPIQTWSPSIAPSGIAFYRGNLFMATLRGQHIRSISLSGNTVISEELLFETENLRFRNVATSPDGLLYFSTDDGKLGRILLSE